jgi:hypothetical protein
MTRAPRSFAAVTRPSLLCALLALACSSQDDGVSYARDVRPLFQARCVLCHDEDSELDLIDPFRPEVGMIAAKNTWRCQEYDQNDPTLCINGHEGPEFNIVPFDPDNSFMMQKITDRGLVPPLVNPPEDEPEHLVFRRGLFMPPRPPLATDAQVATVREWIAAGAQDDDLLRTRVAPILGRSWNFRGDYCNLGGYGPACVLCIGCHYEGGPVYPDLRMPNFEDDMRTPEQNDAALATWLEGLVGVPARYRPDLKLIDPENPDQSFLLMKLAARSPSTAVGAPMPYGYEPYDDAQVETIRRWIAEGARNN